MRALNRSCKRLLNFATRRRTDERLKAAGMRLQRVSNDRYLILWHHQCLARDLTLLEAARLIDRALVRP